MASTTNDDPVLHQALHGYADGHRLLAASRKLPREVERVTLVLSDLSGQGVVEGFESYLTGYPLSSIHAYALARTWYAPEMGRPGCVWTHTLLIDDADLGRLEGFGRLTCLFRRPEGLRFGDYESVIPLSSTPGTEDRWIEHTFAGLLVHLIDALYGSPQRSVAVGIDRADEVEELFLRVWSQQWPALRCSFTFSTGSLSNRTLGGAPFDLQGVPLKDVRRFANGEHAPLVVLHGEPGAPHRAVDQWVTKTCSDLVEPDGTTEFRAFLKRFAEGSPGERKMFRPLAEIYCLASERPKRHLVPEFIGIVTESFPSVSDGAALKQILFGPDETSRVPAVQISEHELLEQLVLTHQATALDPAALSVRKRASELWRSAPAAAESILLRLDGQILTTLGEAFLEGTAEAVSTDSIRTVGTLRPEAVGALVALNPSLAGQAALWNGPVGEQFRLVDVLARHRRAPGFALPSVVAAALSAGTDEVGPEFVCRFGEEVVPHVLEWFDTANTPQRILRAGWQGALMRHAEWCLRWFETRGRVHPQTVFLLTTLLRPGSAEVRRHGVEPWLRSVPASGELARSDFVHVMAFYLALALDQSSVRSFPAARISFEIVYRAAGDGSLDYGSWALVSDQLPSSTWWRDWDRCERLRLGIVSRLLENSWPPHCLFEITSDDHIFQEIVHAFRDARGGTRFLRSVAKEAEDGRIDAPEKRLELLR